MVYQSNNKTKKNMKNLEIHNELRMLCDCKTTSGTKSWTEILFYLKGKCIGNTILSNGSIVSSTNFNIKK